MTTNLIHKAVVNQFLTEAFERLDPQHLPYLVTEDFIAHPWTELGISRGPEGMKRVVLALRSSFSNARVVVKDLIAEGDKVVARYHFEADHCGGFAGVSASGRRVRTHGILVAHMRNGRIAECWREEDHVGLLQQLGAATALESGLRPVA